MHTGCGAFLLSKTELQRVQGDPGPTAEVTPPYEPTQSIWCMSMMMSASLRSPAPSRYAPSVASGYLPGFARYCAHAACTHA